MRYPRPMVARRERRERVLRREDCSTVHPAIAQLAGLNSVPAVGLSR